MTDRALHVALLAGESSGDLLGGPLMASIKTYYPHARFSGIGGKHMQAQGLDSLADMQRLSVMGLVEILTHLPDLLRLQQDCLAYWQQDPPDVFIGIDAPDFNLRMAKALHARKVPTVHYVSPSLWAWKENRIKVIKQAVDLVLCLFPFETNIYDKHGVKAVCVGHPLRDRLQRQDRLLARNAAQLPEQGQLLGIFPGSRQSEIKRMLPLYLSAYRTLKQNLGDVKAFVSVSDAHHRPLIESLLEKAGDLALTVSDHNSETLLSACDVALLSSGTITLESALLQTPMVVAYKVNALTAAIARRLLKIDRFSLPNLLDHRDLVPELIQENAQPQHIAQALLSLFAQPAAREKQQDGFARIADTLPYNVSDKAAKAIIELLSATSPTQ